MVTTEGPFVIPDYDEDREPTLAERRAQENREMSAAWFAEMRAKLRKSNEGEQ